MSRRVDSRDDSISQLDTLRYLNYLMIYGTWLKFAVVLDGSSDLIVTPLDIWRI